LPLISNGCGTHGFRPGYCKFDANDWAKDEDLLADSRCKEATFNIKKGESKILTQYREFDKVLSADGRCTTCGAVTDEYRAVFDR
jgi:hypothetical protein